MRGQNLSDFPEHDGSITYNSGRKEGKISKMKTGFITPHNTPTGTPKSDETLEPVVKKKI